MLLSRSLSLSFCFIIAFLQHFLPILRFHCTLLFRHYYVQPSPAAAHFISVGLSFSIYFNFSSSPLRSFDAACTNLHELSRDRLVHSTGHAPEVCVSTHLQIGWYAFCGTNINWRGAIQTTNDESVYIRDRIGYTCVRHDGDSRMNDLHSAQFVFHYIIRICVRIRFRFILCLSMNAALSSIALGCQHGIAASCHKRLSRQLVISSWQVTVNVLLSLQFSRNNSDDDHEWWWPGVSVCAVSISMPSKVMTVIDGKIVIFMSKQNYLQ